MNEELQERYQACKANLAQKNKLLEFMNSNRRFLDPLYRKTGGRAKWELLVATLNSLGKRSSDSESWWKTWTYLRCRAEKAFQTDSYEKCLAINKKIASILGLNDSNQSAKQEEPVIDKENVNAISFNSSAVGSSSPVILLDENSNGNLVTSIEKMDQGSLSTSTLNSNSTLSSLPVSSPFGNRIMEQFGASNGMNTNLTSNSAFAPSSIPQRSTLIGKSVILTPLPPSFQRKEDGSNINVGQRTKSVLLSSMSPSFQSKSQEFGVVNDNTVGKNIFPTKSAPSSIDKIVLQKQNGNLFNLVSQNEAHHLNQAESHQFNQTFLSLLTTIVEKLDTIVLNLKAINSTSQEGLKNLENSFQSLNLNELTSGVNKVAAAEAQTASALTLLLTQVVSQLTKAKV